MYSSLSVSNRLTLPLILAIVAIQLLLTRTISCLNMTNAYLNHKCYVTQGKYKSESVYDKELTRITRNIPSTTDFSQGYEMVSFDDKSNFVSVVLQCRGDSLGPKCRSCYATALSGLRRRCPKYKGGIIWYDQCFLEFSGIDTVHRNDYDNNVCMSNPKDVSGDPFSFEEKWMSLLYNVTNIMALKKYNDPTSLYGAGERSFGTYKLYGMIQCTRDISRKGCGECFSFQFVQFQNCLRFKRGGRVLGRSCTIRFELYPFVSNSLKI